MRLGYNTNGLAHHRLLDAIDLLAEEGYRSVAITLDAGALDPYDDPEHLAKQVRAVRRRLDHHGLGRVIETGARYLLNLREKHDPTLMDPDPARRAIRQDFLSRALDLAHQLDAEVVSLWSGRAPDELAEEEGLARLAGEIRQLVARAEEVDVALAFEPEPGFFIDTFSRFSNLDERIRHPLFQLTVDIGHVHCIERGAIADHLRRWGPRIRNVHIEDMRVGVHDHLMFGEGTIAFPPVLEALREVGYRGGLHVELSRHSPTAVDAIRRSSAFLSPLL